VSLILSQSVTRAQWHRFQPPSQPKPPSKNHPRNTRDIFVRCFIPLPPFPHLFSTLYKVFRRSRLPLWQVEKGRGDISSFFQSIRKIQNKSKERDRLGNSVGCFRVWIRLVFLFIKLNLSHFARCTTLMVCYVSVQRVV
jgi:hypothetical protein